MTAFNAKPHEVRAMLGCDEFCAIRPLKPQPPKFTPNVIDITEPCQDDETGEWGQWETIWSLWTLESRGEPLDEKWHPLRLPFSVGDLLPVREEKWCDGGPIYDAAGGTMDAMEPEQFWVDVDLTLTVESVAVKRVQDVTEEEARLSGMQVIPNAGVDLATGAAVPAHRIMLPNGREIGGTVSARRVYADAWPHFHPKTPWSENPWVCVARAKVHHCNIAKVTSEEAA